MDKYGQVLGYTAIAVLTGILLSEMIVRASRRYYGGGHTMGTKPDLRPIYRNKCGDRIHLGPLIDAQVSYHGRPLKRCTACQSILTDKEHIAFNDVQITMNRLKLAALQGATPK